ncbi:MAG: hypothetical protein H7Y15_02735 [Pseudonocardia sp.]|nr:hypothetical protein [Pseudonocardia sp.]
MTTEPTDRGKDGSEHEDSALLAELSALLVREPPADVLYAARESFTWRTVGAEIAALQYDSLLDDTVTTRAGGQPRILTFEVHRLTIEVELDTTPSGRRLLGQLVPAQAAELELRSGDRVLATGTADELGRFIVALPTATGRVTLRCLLSDGTTVETASATV